MTMEIYKIFTVMSTEMLLFSKEVDFKIKAYPKVDVSSLCLDGIGSLTIQLRYQF